MSKKTKNTEEPIPQTNATDEVETVEAAQACDSAAAQLQEQLTQAEQKLAEQEKQYQYLAAEYDNFRRRSVREKSDAYASAKSDAAQAFLPVYDNLQRALATPCADEAYAKGVEMTMTQLKAVLEKLGISEIEAQGQPFDPNFHNAVMHVEDETVGESTVVEVFQSGFKMGDKVIRCAMVKVAN